MLRSIQTRWRDLTLSPEATFLLAIVGLLILILIAGVFLIEVRLAGSDARQNLLSGRIQRNAERIELLERRSLDTWDGPRRRAWLSRLGVENPTLVVPDPDEDPGR